MIDALDITVTGADASAACGRIPSIRYSMRPQAGEERFFSIIGGLSGNHQKLIGTHQNGIIGQPGDNQASQLESWGSGGGAAIDSVPVTLYATARVFA